MSSKLHRLTSASAARLIARLELFRELVDQIEEELWEDGLMETDRPSADAATAEVMLGALQGMLQVRAGRLSKAPHPRGRGAGEAIDETQEPA